MLQKFRLEDTDRAGSWKVDEEEHVASITVMIVADEVQMVIGGGSLITLTTDSSGTCGFPTSRKRLTGTDSTEYT